MKTSFVVLAALSASAAAQSSQQPIIMPPASLPPIAQPGLAPAAPALSLPPGVTIPNCLVSPKSGATGVIGEKIIGEKGSQAVIGEKGSQAVIGEKGSEAIIGEKGSEAIIGEKGSEAIVGEKGSEAIVGEKSYAPDNPAEMKFAERWNGSGFTTFKHLIVGKPGPVTLNLYGCSSAGGGETVAVYLADSSGNRKTGWRHFVIATRNGNSREGTLTLPKPVPGQSVSRLPIVVVVENASGRPHVGEYVLTVKP